MIKTVSLETAKKLKDAGFRQDTEIFFNKGGKYIAAPTTDELLDELPDHIVIDNRQFGGDKRNSIGTLVIGNPNYIFNVQYRPDISPCFKNESFPEALAQMYLFLAKEGLLNAKRSI